MGVISQQELERRLWDGANDPHDVLGAHRGDDKWLAQVCVTHAGARTVGKEIRVILKNYALPLAGPLFDDTCAHIRGNC